MKYVPWHHIEDEVPHPVMLSMVAILEGQKVKLLTVNYVTAKNEDEYEQQ